MKTFPMALAAAAAAAAATAAVATPAMALPQTAASAGVNVALNGGSWWNDGRGWNGPRGWDSPRGGRDHPRLAVEQCVRAAERDAQRAGFRRANVTDIRNVRDTRWGYEVRGRIEVNTGWRGDDRFGRGWNDNRRGFDSGNFRCQIERGRITRLNYSGIRGL